MTMQTLKAEEMYEMELLENLDAMFCIKNRTDKEVAATYIKKFRMYQKRNEVLKELPLTVVFQNVVTHKRPKPFYGMTEDQIVKGYLSLLGYR